MEYSFDNEAISYYNRVEAVLGGRSIAEYGLYGSNPLVAAMWHFADTNLDTGGEGDVVDGQYPFMAKYWSKINKDIDPNTGEYDEQLDKYNEVWQLANEFEGKLFLACLTAAAVLMLKDSLPVDPWTEEHLNAINSEFAKDRKELAHEMKVKLGLLKEKSA